MTPDKPNPARTGSGDAVCLSSSSAADVRIDRPPRPNPQAENRAPNLRIVPSPSPPRPRRLDVRISVADARSPIGRTGIFRLYPQDIERLIDALERLEARY
jgi:hypothetical protein